MGDEKTRDLGYTQTTLTRWGISARRPWFQMPGKVWTWREEGCTLLGRVMPKHWPGITPLLPDLNSGGNGFSALENKAEWQQLPLQESDIRFTISGNGPPILFLHGIPTSRSLWEQVAGTLQERFTCVAVDLPGMGESPRLSDGSLDPSRYADEIELLRRRLSFPAWEIVGHDAGSTIAVHYAARYPERVGRLVLCSPPIFPDFRIPWYFRAMRMRLAGDCLAPFVPLFWRFAFPMAVRRLRVSTPEVVREFEAPFAGYGGARRFIGILRWGDPKEVLARTADLLPQILAPTLILQGKHDGAVPPSFAHRAASIMPAARTELLDHGHFLPLECPELLCKHISGFLNGSTALCL
jgi:pimeloyl-ACP methyl ester carboxylesterase